jgi:hypothetical protein
VQKHYLENENDTSIQLLQHMYFFILEYTGQHSSLFKACFLFVKLCWHMKNIKLYISFDMQRSKMIKRVVNGVQSFHQAIKLAPDAWTAMLIRTLLKPESQHFVLDVFSALANHSSYKIPETFWLCISRYLNYTNKHDTL